jgi:hypothetical protein
MKPQFLVFVSSIYFSRKSGTAFFITSTLNRSPPSWSFSTRQHYQYRRRWNIHLLSILKERTDGAEANARKSTNETKKTVDLNLVEDKKFGFVEDNNCLLVFDSQKDDSTESKSEDLKSHVYLPYDENASEVEVITDQTLRLIPSLVPIVAFLLYDPTATLFASTMELINPNNWVAVDGGAYQAKIIAPLTNGVVVPAISILFAILIGQTITTLRQRQYDLQLCITMEASRLSQLQTLLADFPDSAIPTFKCKSYLQQYTSRLIFECHETVNLDFSRLSGMDSELNEVFRALNQAASAENGEYSTMLIDQAFILAESLSEERSKRITALQSTFPMLHYTILTALALSICVAFLMETNQELLIFLNAIQLRLLWTMLVGTFCALALVCYDLGHPFRGAYQISQAVRQLYTIRQGWSASLETKNDQNESLL